MFPFDMFMSFTYFGACQICVLRVNDAPASYPVPALETPEQAYAFWQEHVANSAWFTPDQECVISILLNVRCAVIGWNLVSLGTLTESIVHPREVLRPAVAANAYAFVLAHNHPSGNPTPSLADHDSTRTIQTAAAAEVTAKELEFILALRSNDPAIGYNRWPKAKDVSKA